ncbi:aspartate aminotransferase [Pelagivirga sediminicola]|uniref:Aminotransferase n=1 Tax=Pelagivirga sediminicola TaxID=2170575 RepID=A0A2T7G8A4_9RHOB|nr:aminotransferase class I/II-fold pyridoxal phosphate-dependent enzyme [Pelagivirga sediminicola]PVA10655.1 aspartate aminotransferase [Pelagivirga sediminicola]
MKVSSRLTNITGGGSGGWDLFNRARAMKQSGIPVTELTIGEHDTPTDPSILNAMHAAALAGHTGYTTIGGLAPLRERVAQRVEARTGVATGPENVLIVPGGQAGLFAALMATCEPGDTALYIDPYYATYPGTIRAAGAVPKPVKARSRHGFQPAGEDIDAAADSAAALLINSPNNPTGAVYSGRTLADIAEVCARREMWLISDEVYDTQVWSGTHVSSRALPGMAERTLVVGSMSKSHAMTGSRIGWIIGPQEAIAQIANLTTHTTYGVSGFTQMAACHALDRGEPFEAQIAAPFRRRRDMVMAQIAAQNVVRAIPAEGAMYVMLDLRATGLSGDAFANLLLDTHHVAVMPGESFGAAAAGHVRVALTVDDARLETAIAQLLDLAAHETVPNPG